MGPARHCALLHQATGHARRGTSAPPARQRPCVRDRHGPQCYALDQADRRDGWGGRGVPGRWQRHCAPCAERLPALPGGSPAAGRPRPLRLRVKRPVVAAGAPSRHLSPVSSEEPERGGRDPRRGGGGGGGGYRQARGGTVGGRDWPAEPRGLHGGLTRRQASPRRTPAERSRGPRTSAHQMTPAHEPFPQAEDGRHKWHKGHNISHRQVPGQPNPCTVTPPAAAPPCAP